MNIESSFVKIIPSTLCTVTSDSLVGTCLVVDDLLLLEGVMIQLVDAAGEIATRCTSPLNLSTRVLLCHLGFVQFLYNTHNLNIVSYS